MTQDERWNIYGSWFKVHGNTGSWFMVNGSRFFDEPSDRSTFGRLQGKKVDDMVNTNFSMTE